MMNERDPVTYAGLGRRTAAFALDYLLIVVYLGLIVALGLIVRAAFPAAQRVLFSSPARGELTGFLLVTLPVTLYFALSESSARQASWGKRRMRLAVIGPDGGRIGRWRGLARNALKFVPWELAHFTIWRYAFLQGQSSPALDALLVLVWLLVGANLASILLSRTHQAIYDMLAKTWVIRRA